ncbi:MAG TPA: hypothetical protein VJJ98_13355 [Sedimentisphaerales bacterium]|nr:hypothetical protein [Sedimentisphaerales bacterium]
MEKVFNDTNTSLDDIYYPPKFSKPPQPKSHTEYKLTAIRQLVNVLGWWVKEDGNDPRLLCYYAYSYAACGLRANIVDGWLDSLITEFNYSHPAIAAELKERASDLVKKAVDWDARAELVQQSQCWINPKRLNPVQVKKAAAALLYKLRHVGSLVREQPADSQQQVSRARKPAGTERKDIWEDIQPDMKEAIQEFWKESKAKKSEGKRPLIKTFCRERDLDERTFRSEKDRLEKRRKRLEKAD